MSDVSMDARLDHIAAKLRAAAQGGRQPFGVENHQFRLNPPLTESQLTEFESCYEVALPPEYPAFVAHVADGGAGPAYGMYALRNAVGPNVPDDFLRTPFPHAQSYNAYNDPVEKAFWERVESGEISEAEADQRRLYGRAGTLNLCDEGCGYQHFLVVTGPSRGRMWIDGEVSDGGFCLLKVGFLDWYERWLDDVLAGGDGVWWLKRQAK